VWTICRPSTCGASSRVDKPIHRSFTTERRATGSGQEKLLELKPNIRKMWPRGELTNLFESHEIVIAMGWPLNTADLRQANFPVGETIPKENTTDGSIT